jgi:hypothetical protein
MGRAHSFKIYSIYLHLLSIPPIFWLLMMGCLTIPVTVTKLVVTRDIIGGVGV